VVGFAMMHPPAGQRPETRPPRDGDPTAQLEADDAGTLAALYERHAGAMYSLAMRIVGEPTDAEAIVQGVFAAAWTEAGRRPRGHAPNIHWLLATTRVRAIDYVRAAGAGSESTPALPAPKEAATLHLPDPARGQVTDEHGPDDVPRLRSAFRQLPPLERLAIELAYFDGLTISRIAMHLEQAPETANARIRSGLRRLAGSVGGPRMGEPHRDMPPTPELTGLYALGALNASERAAFDAHLEVNRESVEEVLLLLPVARRLAWTVPPHELPRGLRDRIMETVTGAPLPGAARREATESGLPQADAPLEPRTETAATPADHADPDSAAQAAAGSEHRAARTGSSLPELPPGPEPADGSHPERAVTASDTVPVEDIDELRRSADDATQTVATPLAQQPAPTPITEEATPAMPTPTSSAQKQSGRWVFLSLVAGSLIVAAGLGLVAVRQSGLATALQENLDAANTQARIAELETAAARRVAGELRAGAGILTAADVQTLDLTGQPAAPEARGRLFWSTGGSALLAATGLPPLPPGRIYQLWLIPDATPISAGLLAVDAEGRVMATVTAPGGGTERVPAALTLEPAGGAESPGGDVYLLGRP
jgi:RNA polymerase sigma-70 factor (ECF subfamily)